MPSLLLPVVKNGLAGQAWAQRLLQDPVQSHGLCLDFRRLWTSNRRSSQRPGPSPWPATCWTRNPEQVVSSAYPLSIGRIREGMWCKTAFLMWARPDRNKLFFKKHCLIDLSNEHQDFGGTWCWESVIASGISTLTEPEDKRSSFSYYVCGCTAQVQCTFKRNTPNPH